MTTLYFARHGETEWHAEHRYAGSSDVALVPEAVAQAAGLAAWAGAAELSAIVTSTLSRARLTAEPAAAAAGLPLRVDTRLVEIAFGRGEGMSPAELAAMFPDDWAAFERQPAQHPLPGGESGREGIARAMSVFDELAEEFPEGRVLVVGHATLMRLMLCELIGLDPNWYRDIFPAFDNSALLELDFPYAGESSWPGRARILGINVPPASRIPG